MRKIAIVGLVVVVAIISGSLAGYLILCGNNQISTSPPRDIGDGKLFISNPPALGQTATLTYILENLSGITPGMTLSCRIVLENGLVWLENRIPGKRLIWENRYLVENVHFPENENLSGRVEVGGTIKAVETGRWNIVAFTVRAAYDNIIIHDFPPNYMPEILLYKSGRMLMAGAVINLSVSESSAQVEEGWYLQSENDNRGAHGGPSVLALLLD
jgi:hypothetical protein